MASIVERPQKSGEITFQIKWRQDGDWQTERFADVDSFVMPAAGGVGVLAPYLAS